MPETFKKITKNFERTGVLSEDVARFLRMHDCPDTIKHVKAVAEEAKTLAARFFENQEGAFSAGLLHDVSTIFSNEERLTVATELKIDVLPEEKNYPAILHQKISKVMAEEIFGITDENVLSAIGCHTTLKENASVLDKIVFISDKIRWDREYNSPFKDDVLKALEISLDEACFCYLNYLWNNKENLAVVHPWMAAAYKQLGSSLKKRDYLDQANKSKHWEQRNSPALEYLKILKHHDKNYAGKTLLDVGCAEGVEVGEFRKLGLKADGVDINGDFVGRAQKRFPEAKFAVGNAESLPCEDQSYDIIFSINTLFYTDIKKSIPEFCRVLKKGGRSVVSFDTEIFNLDEGAVFHSDSVEHLKNILEKEGAKIEELGESEERTDKEPFRHKHIFHKVVFRK